MKEKNAVATAKARAGISIAHVRKKKIEKLAEHLAKEMLNYLYVHAGPGPRAPWPPKPKEPESEGIKTPPTPWPKVITAYITIE